MIVPQNGSRSYGEANDADRTATSSPSRYHFTITIWKGEVEEDISNEDSSVGTEEVVYKRKQIEKNNLGNRNKKNIKTKVQV